MGRMGCAWLSTALMPAMYATSSESTDSWAAAWGTTMKRRSSRQARRAARIISGRNSALAVSRNPFLRPRGDGGHGSFERAAPLGELVLHAHGRLGNHNAVDDFRLLQLAQPLGEHAVADV